MIRYPGIFRAFVADIVDPEHRGRIRVRCPLVMGVEEQLPWALPCFPYGGSEDIGFFAIPPEGSVVWIMFEQGDPNKPVWLGSWIPAPGNETWAPMEAVRNENGSSDRWPNNDTPGEGQGDHATIRDGSPSKLNPTNHVIIRSPEGHMIEVDDTQDQRKIVFRDCQGQLLVFRSEPGGMKILMKDAVGNYIWLDAVGKKIKIEDTGGNHIVLDAEDESVHLEDVNGDYIDMKDGVINIIADPGLGKESEAKIYLHCPRGVVTVDATEIILAEDVGNVQKVARIGDKVDVTYGSSAGQHEIVSGSDVVKAGG